MTEQNKTFIWTLECSRSDHSMGAFSTKELALEALVEVRNKVVKRWGVQVSRIKDDAFMVLDETYYLNKLYLNTYVTEYTLEAQ